MIACNDHEAVLEAARSLAPVLGARAEEGEQPRTSIPLFDREWEIVLERAKRTKDLAARLAEQVAAFPARFGDLRSSRVWCPDPGGAVGASGWSAYRAGATGWLARINSPGS